jgi:hypothetical protein
MTGAVPTLIINYSRLEGVAQQYLVSRVGNFMNYRSSHALAIALPGKRNFF